MAHGTVQKPLTSGEALEFGAALMQQLGRDIDPEKARYYIGHKSQLSKDLRKLGIHKVPEFDTAAWKSFYQKHFGLAVDFSNLHVPAKPEYACRAIVVVPNITNNEVFDVCTKAFKTWRYEGDLNTVTDVVKRPSTPYVVWVRAVVEADEEMKNKSAEDIEASSTNTLTLKERMLLELVYFDETGKHLDLDNWTLCAGSRYAYGYVPYCNWSDAKFNVHWTPRGNRYPLLLSRVAVS